MFKTLLAATAATALATAPAVALDHHKEMKMAKSDKANYGKGETIAAVAMDTDSLSTLVAAVKAGDLVNVLKGEGPYTVFAPTNDAFGEIQSTVNTLLQPENKPQLQKVLKAHVVAGELSAADLTMLVEANDGQVKLSTVSGDIITITQADGALVITDESGNDAGVVSANVEADNGVVHVVDTVLVPQA
jgi:uncharacterized surface protein with fasciclin (FAS1) repeats